MRIALTTTNKAKQTAKTLKKILHFQGLPVSLSTVQEITSRLFGYSNWHELVSVKKRGSGLSRSLNEQQLRDFFIREGLGTEIADSIARSLGVTEFGHQYPSEAAAFTSFFIDMIGRADPFHFSVEFSPPYKVSVYYHDEVKDVPVNGKKLNAAISRAYDTTPDIPIIGEGGVAEFQTDTTKPLKNLRIWWSGPAMLEGSVTNPSGLKFIADAQSRLKQIGLYSGRVSGTIDYNTRKSLKALQGRHQMPLTGGIGPKELQVLDLGHWLRPGYAEGRMQRLWLSDAGNSTRFDPNS